MFDLWPKYLQAGLNELYYTVTNMKEQRIQLSKEEFDELPITHLDSLPDYELFENYMLADMIIEVTRFLKYQLMHSVLKQQSSAEKERDLQFLQEHCLNEILREDEFKIYQGLI